MTAHCIRPRRLREVAARASTGSARAVLLRAACAVAFLAALSPLHAAETANYPIKPIRIVVPFPPGGSTDFFARSIGQKLTEAWGQQVIVDNRTGANGIVGTEIVAKSAPDGYNLLMCAIGHAANASLYKKLPYDTMRDFAPVNSFADVPMFLALHPSVKANTVPELIALAKSKPGGLNVAAGGVGASHHLAAELFRVQAKLDWQYIQYRGGGPALLELVSGKTDIMFTPVSTALGQVRAGKLKALGVTTPQRVPLAPDLPTIAEAGLPGFEARAWYGIVASAKVPRDIVLKLNAQINELLKNPQFSDALIARGAVPMGGSVDDFAKFLRNEIQKYAAVVKASGIRVD
jgi:tripartite-type tricarboxylate transporter receptor subunit TctC